MSGVVDWISVVLLTTGGLALTIFGVLTRMDPGRPVRRVVAAATGIGASLAFGVGAAVDEKLRGTAAGVVIAIAVSGLVFEGANRWFDRAERGGRGFGALTGAVVGFGVAALLVGNRLVAWRTGPGAEAADLTRWLVVVGLGVAAGFGGLLSGSRSRRARLGAAVAFGLLVAGLAGAFLREDAFPALRPAVVAAWTAGWAVVGGGWSAVRRRGLLRGAVGGVTVGWTVAAWVLPPLGGGTRLGAMLAAFGLALGSGAWLALRGGEEGLRRGVGERSRAVIFLTPALVFVGATLVVPTLRTIYLSFLGPRGQEFVGWGNYRFVFSDPGIVKVDEWRRIFGSSLFLWGIALAVLGLVVGRLVGRRTGRAFEASGGSVVPISAGVFLLSWAVFAYLRGTVFNNLWWVATVTIVATAMGLAVAVLADRARLESVAKSIIFMPMAISFVGAGIIWRFMYIARPPSKPQTGVLNALWVALGQLSHSQVPKMVVAAVLAVTIAGLGVVAWRGWRAGATGVAGGALAVAAPVAWVLYRLLGPGLGGYEVGPGGEIVPATVLFIQETPFNNVWLMLVLIWIEVGFTMVIFSAAIKAVPAELVEAAKVDGATESQTFWRIVVPQIAPTIGVVVTTLIVLVMKVFDIVKVMTNGNFDTQVLANEMWQRAFTEFNFGLGSALAVLLFVSVLPIMVFNIRRMQREAA